EYLIVGGWAVSVHAEPRFTKDLDVLIGVDPSNLERVADALSSFGAPPDVVRSVAALSEGEFMFFGTPPARVDLLRTIPGVDFAAAWGRRVEVTWDGVTVYVISRDDLIAAKRAAGRVSRATRGAPARRSRSGRGSCPASCCTCRRATRL